MLHSMDVVTSLYAGASLYAASLIGASLITNYPVMFLHHKRDGSKYSTAIHHALKEINNGISLAQNNDGFLCSKTIYSDSSHSLASFLLADLEWKSLVMS